jgi:hypothetical protein
MRGCSEEVWRFHDTLGVLPADAGVFRPPRAPPQSLSVHGRLSYLGPLNPALR